MQIDLTQLIDIQGVINFINEVVSKGVPINGEISISDGIAFKSLIAGGIITIVSTFIATKASSKNTLALFEKQEKFKKRDDLRLKFFEEYEQMYKYLYISLGEFMREKEYKSGLLSVNENGFVSCYLDSIETIEDILEDYKDDEYKNLKNLAQELLKNLENLKAFMKSKELITGYKSFKYEDQLKAVKRLNDKLSQLQIRYMVCEVIKLKGNAVTEETQKDIFKYKNILHSVYTDKTISNLEESIESIDQDIRKEFIGYYFLDKDSKL